MSLFPNDRCFLLPCFLPLLSVPLTLVLATVEVVPALHKHYRSIVFPLVHYLLPPISRNNQTRVIFVIRGEVT